MPTLEVADGDLKMLRETFCVAQTGLSKAHIARLQGLINQIDVYRPLGPDGKHDQRHTATCGCEDK
jgi:hypothetical protein